MKEHLLCIKRKEKIFCLINFTLFHITLHVIFGAQITAHPVLLLKALQIVQWLKGSTMTAT